MVGSDGILAEVRLAVEHVASVCHLEADHVLTAVLFASELPAQVVEQAAQLDVIAAFVGADVVAPVVVSNRLILAVSVGIYASAFQVGYGAGGFRQRVKRTLAHLCHQVGSGLFVTSQAQQAFRLDEHGIRQTEENPWDSVAERYPVGTRVKGKIRNFTSYGAFLQLEDGIDGMIHVSDMSWTRKVVHPTEMLQKGQELEAVVLEVDAANKRISLGLKQAQEDPWVTISSRYQVGQKIKGKVSRLASFGAFVDLGNGVDGLVHISQISEDHVERVRDALKVGQEVEARIVRIEREERRIGLSLRLNDTDDANFTMPDEYKGADALKAGQNIVGLASAFDEAFASGGEEWKPEADAAEAAGEQASSEETK